MKEIKISLTFRIITSLLILVGIGTFIFGFSIDPQRTWANYLINNYYFLSVSIGAAFFLAIQYISKSGWSAGFKRVPEAIMMYIPFAAIFFILIYFGMHDLYHWSNEEFVAHDTLLQHKISFLNIPFFFLRMVLIFTLWIIFIFLLRKFSLKEDIQDPGNEADIARLFEKSELFSKIFIFILAISFTISTIDWIMSIDVHWYSTIFALKNFIAAFLHGVTIIVLILFILNKKGYFPFLNEYHLHDFSRYIFMLAIVWGYFWFAQFMIIWYGNIPEETSYYYFRWQNGWKTLFFIDIAINWAIPFIILLPVKTCRNMAVISIVIFCLIIGQYIDLYLQIIPGTTGILKFGWIEAGIFIGYTGLFALIVTTALSKAKLVPPNHPFIEESLNHHF